LRESLIHFASLIELELDFGEEDVEFADRDDLRQLIHRIQSVLVPLIDSFEMGNVIKNGVPTVIVGKPNAGKSTLLNRLLNEEKPSFRTSQGLPAMLLKMSYLSKVFVSV
jgi:tRNA modification GTPase